MPGADNEVVGMWGALIDQQCTWAGSRQFCAQTSGRHPGRTEHDPATLVFPEYHVFSPLDLCACSSLCQQWFSPHFPHFLGWF